MQITARSIELLEPMQSYIIAQAPAPMRVQLRHQSPAQSTYKKKKKKKTAREAMGVERISIKAGNACSVSVPGVSFEAKRVGLGPKPQASHDATSR